MYAIVFTAVPKTSDRQDLLQFLMWDCEVCQTEPGTLRFDVIEDPRGDTIYVFECYQDREAFERHKENAPYQKWAAEIAPNLKVTRLFEGEPLCVLLGKQLELPENQT